MVNAFLCQVLIRNEPSLHTYLAFFDIAGVRHVAMLWHGLRTWHTTEIIFLWLGYKVTQIYDSSVDCVSIKKTAEHTRVIRWLIVASSLMINDFQTNVKSLRAFIIVLIRGQSN